MVLFNFLALAEKLLKDLLEPLLILALSQEYDLRNYVGVTDPGCT